MTGHTDSWSVSNRSSRGLFAALVAVAIVARLCVATLGHNHDFRSYLRVGRVVSAGANVYAELNRYNYAPLFSVVQGTLYSLAQGFADPVVAYRIFIILFLSTFDVILGAALYRRASIQAAALFLLNPITVIITGYHNQFDNVAVCAAYFGARWASARTEFSLRDVVAVSLLALSLIVKHLLFIFPVWILLLRNFPLNKRFIYASVPPLLFLVSFIPYVDEGWNGIVRNVFLYSSKNNFPLLGWLFQSFSEQPRVWYRPAFILLMVAIGWSARHKTFEESLLLYFMALVSVSSAIANQYLAIPILSLCLIRDPLRYLYFFLASVFLALSPSGLHIAERLPPNIIVDTLGSWGYTLLTGTLFIIVIRAVRNNRLL
jgi:hypothetical protein